MQRLLNTMLLRKPLSDTEYVEEVRKGLHRSKRFDVVSLVLTAVLLLVIMATLTQLRFIVPPLVGGPIAPGFAIGLVTGLCLGIWGVHIGHDISHAIILLNGDRSSRLLVEYHDALAVYREGRSQEASRVEVVDGNS